ncbi:MAG: hypothetical protein VX106_01715 [Pseudomonadota bacterium]|nr:hypothetical protein [Pseudomonadota bacterium]
MSDYATGKRLARDSIQNLRNYPHPLARPLALCFAFEPANTQFIAATCLELGFTLDTALATPSESALAMIRLQWWIDSIQDTAPAHVPLAQNLHFLIENQPNIGDQLVSVIGHWQSACHDDNRNSQQGWQALWQLLGKTLGHDADTVASIGIFCLSSDAPCPADMHDKTRLLALRRTVPAGYSQWVYLLACFGIYLQQLGENHQANADFTLLGWRLLMWWLGLPPQHRAAIADHP